MKQLLLVANWKSNKTSEETKQWFERIANGQLPMEEQKTVVVCPAYTSLPQAKSSVVNHQLAVKLGGQDISPFDHGAYTGEIYGNQIKEFGDYVIVGHSERRQYFGETDELLGKKVAMAVQAGLTVIFCVQGKDTPVPQGVSIVAYEPVSAIGTGHPDTPADAEEVAKSIKESHPYVQLVLYGGSVKPDNVGSFTNMAHIDGVLVGGASLDPEIFSQLIHNT